MFAKQSSVPQFVSPVQSERTVLITVQDLINSAMGPPEENKVNFKLIQTILHILARQMRIQEQFVDLGYKNPPICKMKAESNSNNIGDEEQNRKWKEKESSLDEEKKERNEKEKPNDAKDREKVEQNQKVKEIESSLNEEQKERNEKENPEDAKDREKIETDRNEKDMLTKADEREKTKFVKEKYDDRKQHKESESKAKLSKTTENERAECEETEIEATERGNNKNKKKEEQFETTDSETDLAKMREVYVNDNKQIQNAKNSETTSPSTSSEVLLSKKPHSTRSVDSKEKAKLAKPNESKSKHERDKEEKHTTVKTEREEKEIQNKKREKAKERERKEQDKVYNEKQKIEEKERKEKDKVNEEREKTKKRESKEKVTVNLVKMTDKKRAEYEKEDIKKPIEKRSDRKEKEEAKLETTDKETISSSLLSLSLSSLTLSSSTLSLVALLSNKPSSTNSATYIEKTKLTKLDEKKITNTEHEKHKEEEQDNKSDREEKQTEKEKYNIEREKAKEREWKEKEKTKLAKMTDKERAVYEKEKIKRALKRGKEDKKKVEMKLAQIREVYLRDAQQIENAAKLEIKKRENAMLAKITDQERTVYERQIAKEQEREEQGKGMLAKITDKERAEYEEQKAKEREKKKKTKLAKMTDNERTEYERLKAKEQERKEKAKLGNMTDKEYEKTAEYEKNKAKLSKLEKIKVSQTRVGSIEVVTRSEFELLKAKVKELEQKTIPIPFPSMPENEKLRTELASGSASLTDTMQAMQVSARVQATETAMGRMAYLLTQLAAAGALPEDVVDRVGVVTVGMGRRTSGEARREVDGVSRGTGTLPADGVAGRNIGTSSKDDDEDIRFRTTFIGIADDDDARNRYSFGTPSVGVLGSRKYSGISTASKAHSIKSRCVTRSELDDAQLQLKDSMIKKANEMVMKAHKLAEVALINVKLVADQMEIITSMAARIDALFSLINDYAEELAGFNAGVSTQLQNFNEQISLIQCELNDGVALFNQTIANSETEDVKDLKARYGELIIMLDITSWSHKKLTAYQSQLSDELRSVVECVEMLREEKANRDLVLDGLGDKADKSQLTGMLLISEFNKIQATMERQLTSCHDKFHRQELAWMSALQELKVLTGFKSDVRDLMRMKADIQDNLMEIQHGLSELVKAIGEPKAALLTRRVSKDGHCGACTIEARQEAIEVTYGLPTRLPALRRHFPHTDAVCVMSRRPPPTSKRQICHRWVGGSHTILSESVVRTQSLTPVHPFGLPKKSYRGFGDEGKLYMMEEMLEPCLECNQLGNVAEILVDGAGDTGVTKKNGR